MTRAARPRLILRPSVLFAGSLAAVAGAMALVYHDSMAAADRLIALRDGPPMPVAVEAFDPASDSGPTGEVMLRAQIDVTAPMPVIYRDGLQRMRAVAYAMLPADAAPAPDGVRPTSPGYLYFAAPLDSVEPLDPVHLLLPRAGHGRFGPILNLNGEIGAPAPLNSQVADAMAGQNLVLAESALALSGYPTGRMVALAKPRGSPWRPWLLVLGMALFAAGVVQSHRMPRIEAARHEAGLTRPNRRPASFPDRPTSAKGRHRLAPLAPQPDQSRPS